MTRVVQTVRQFVPLTDDEIYALLEQGLGHRLVAYGVGRPCLHRGTSPVPLAAEHWPLAHPRQWPEVA